MGKKKRNDPGGLRLWPMRWALVASSVAAVAGLVGLTWIARWQLHYPKLARSSKITLHDYVSVLQLVFASVAGAGALVALVMAYRRQKALETTTAHDRTRVLNERFTTIAGQLGDNQPAAVRLAGVHAMAGLADDWEENRQTCIDVLCAYLRLPYQPDPGNDAPAAERLAYRAIGQVRHTVIRVITAHLRKDAAVSWQGKNLDFTGGIFDGGNFGGAEFSGGAVSFTGAKFSGGVVSFTGAKFSGGVVGFDWAEFSYGDVDFAGAEFSGGVVSFAHAQFSGSMVDFAGAEFSGGVVSFGANFSDGGLDFAGAEFSDGAVSFAGAEFSGGVVSFAHAQFSGSMVDFAGAEFSGGVVSFGANFSDGGLDFAGAEFSDGAVSFAGALFSGSVVDFSGEGFSGGGLHLAGAKFSGGTVDFSGAFDWSHPPLFDWAGAPPPGVKLPAAAATEA